MRFDMQRLRRAPEIGFSILLIPRSDSKSPRLLLPPIPISTEPAYVFPAADFSPYGAGGRKHCHFLATRPFIYLGHNHIPLTLARPPTADGRRALDAQIWAPLSCFQWEGDPLDGLPHSIIWGNCCQQGAGLQADHHVGWMGRMAVKVIDKGRVDLAS